MKITSDQKIESPSKEVLDIHIEFDPSNPTEEGYVALVGTLVDLINRNKVMADALNRLEQDDLDRREGEYD